MNRKMVAMVVALVVVFGGLAAFNLFRSYKIDQFVKNFQTPPVTVSTTVAKRRDWRPVLNFVGTVKAVQGVNVTSQQSGQIIKISFASGDFVEQGKVLVELNSATDRATLAEDEADLELAKVNYQRQVELYKKAATSKQEVDTKLSELKSDKAKTEKTMVTIRQKSIQAPFTGMIGIREVDQGEYVTTGSTTIASLQSLDPLYIDFYLPEQYLPNIKLGDAVYFTIDAYPDQYFSAKIHAVDSKVNTDSHNIKVRTAFDNCGMDALLNKDHHLITEEKVSALNITALKCDQAVNKAKQIKRFAILPGMFSKVTLLLPKISNAMVLPATTVSYTLYGDSVYVVKHKTEPKTGKTIAYVKQQFVKIGGTQGNDVLITKGVEAGDVVVNAGQLKLHNDTTVKINNTVKLDAVPNIKAMGE